MMLFVIAAVAAAEINPLSLGCGRSELKPRAGNLCHIWQWLWTCGFASGRALNGAEHPQVRADGGHLREDQRLARLEQAVDAIAIEVERISEGQRFTTRLLSEQKEAARQTLPSGANR